MRPYLNRDHSQLAPPHKHGAPVTVVRHLQTCTKEQRIH